MNIEKFDTDRITELYHQAKCEILESFEEFKIVEAEKPKLYFAQKHKLNKSISVIDTIVKNLVTSVSCK